MVNDCADKNDNNRNRVNYGAVSYAARTLYRLGIKVDIGEYEDKGFIRITRVTVAGETIEFSSRK